MSEKPPMMHPILLTDGTILEATGAQVDRINMAILSTHDFQKIQVKLQGRYFKLGELETDPEKLANARQQGLPLNDKKRPEERNMG